MPWLDVDEPQVVELADGSIRMNMRSGKEVRRRIEGLSDDGGASWGKQWIQDALIEPPCQASIFRYTRYPEYGKNRLLFSNPASREQRIKLTVRLSFDEGVSWPVSRELHSGPAAYSSLAVLADMTIGCLYERGASSAYEKITFARLSLDWLSRGTDRLDRRRNSSRP